MEGVPYSHLKMLTDTGFKWEKGEALPPSEGVVVPVTSLKTWKYDDDQIIMAALSLRSEAELSAVCQELRK